MFKTTRKTRIWLGWLVIFIMGIGAFIIIMMFFSQSFKEWFVAGTLAGLIIFVPAFCIWFPINYRPFMKQKAQ